MNTNLSSLDKVFEMLHDMHTYIGIMSFGGIGGIVYLFLTGKDAGIKAVSKAFVVSAFTGLIAGLLVRYLGLDDTLAFVVSGLFGFAGGFALIWMLAIVHKKLGLASDASLQELKETIQNPSRPESVMTELIHKGYIDIVECKQILDGDMSPLMRVLAEGHLDGSDLERISCWQKSLVATKRG